MAKGLQGAMRCSLPVLLSICISCCAYAATPALTIYNQDFAVVRDVIPLTLQAGVNHVKYSGMTANAEPDSVILRDPPGKVVWQILEQNYRADAASVDRMLTLYEGKTIQFDLGNRIVAGRIVRAQPPRVFGQPNFYYQPAYDPNQVMVEIEGQIRFGLPGTPLFPAGADQVLLKPSMNWTIRSDRKSSSGCGTRLCHGRAYVEGQLQRGFNGDQRSRRPHRVGND